MAQQKLYIGNLPYYTTEREVRQLFKSYEPIHAISMICDKDTGASRGYGFIELEEPKAESAIYEMCNKVVGGRILRISKATGRGRRTYCTCETDTTDDICEYCRNPVRRRR